MMQSTLTEHNFKVGLAQALTLTQKWALNNFDYSYLDSKALVTTHH